QPPPPPARLGRGARGLLGPPRLPGGGPPGGGPGAAAAAAAHPRRRAPAPPAREPGPAAPGCSRGSPLDRRRDASGARPSGRQPADGPAPAPRDYRPEYRHDWGGKTYYRQLRLDPLAPESPTPLLD